MKRVLQKTIQKKVTVRPEFGFYNKFEQRKCSTFQICLLDLAYSTRVIFKIKDQEFHKPHRVQYLHCKTSLL